MNGDLQACPPPMFVEGLRALGWTGLLIGLVLGAGLAFVQSREPDSPWRRIDREAVAAWVVGVLALLAGGVFALVSSYQIC